MHECKHGCGYKHRHQGSMNLHENVHCKTLRKQPAPKKKQQPKQQPQQTRYCDCDDEPSWTFLNRNDPIEARAIAAGYKKICRECGEVV